MKRIIQLILNIVVPILALVLTILLVPRMFLFFIPFVIGALIAFIANPLIRFLNTRTRLLERQHASVFIIILLLILIGGLLYLCIHLMIHVCADVIKGLPDMIHSFTTCLHGLIEAHPDLLQRLPGKAGEGTALMNLDQLNSSLEDTLLSFATKFSAPLANVSISAVRSIPNLLVYAVVTIFSSYCFCKDGERYVDTVKSWIPKEFLHYIHLLKADIQKIFQGWLLAQFKIMFVVFSVLCIGFLLLHIRYALPIAALTAFLDFLPMLGVGFILWPWILVDLLSGNPWQAMWLAVIYALTQIVRQFMQPKIMGETMGLSPFLTILFMYLGYRFYGFAGLIFAVPVGMLVMCFYRYGAFRKMIQSIQDLYRILISFL